MKVLKFGGSSVADANNIRRVKQIVEADAQNKFVVVSALGGITDQLIRACTIAAAGSQAYTQEIEGVAARYRDAATQLLGDSPRRNPVLGELDMLLAALKAALDTIHTQGTLTASAQDDVLSFGERMSAYLISQVIDKAEYVDARQLIITDDNYGHAKVNFSQTNAQCSKILGGVAGRAVIPGFIAATREGHTTTLGRGGSDYTASILGAAVGASMVEIWTDVDGFLTADPRQVEKAFPIAHMSYLEVFELSNFGAKVVYPQSMYPLLSANIPMLIKNTFNPQAPGTLVDDTPQDKLDSSQQIKGISSIENIALLTLQGVGLAGISGISKRLFGALATAQVNVILISQVSSEQSITFAITPAHMEAARKHISAEFEAEMHRGIIELKVEQQLSIIAVVGENMRRTPGVSGKLFNALGKNGVNVVAIAQGSSELNISCVVPHNYLSKALNVIHEAFFLSGYKEINLFMAGIGTVGGDLLKQLNQQRERLMEHHHLKINLVGVMNSSKMLVEPAGIPFMQVKEVLAQRGTPIHRQQFVEQAATLNLRNSVFVDCTASADVAALYEGMLSSFVSVVTANKIACSGEYAHYLKLQQTARSRGVKFLYETNVGAGLPIIKTIDDLILSGDKVLKLEAVLSGTLNFIFNTLSEAVPMSKAIMMAKEKGYSEPDPRIDLSGVDVLRKILILSRECGYPLDKQDVEVNTFLPDACFATPHMDEFWSQVQQLDADFEARRKALAAKGLVWRFVATMDHGKARIGLQEVDSTHPFYNLQGSDNILAIFTERYGALPMVIKGAGAGAAVTASGVFADIIRIANI